MGGTMPGVPMADLTRPPPGFQATDTVPTAPYYDLPAGLMVSLVKFDESKHKCHETTTFVKSRKKEEERNTQVDRILDLFYDN